MRHLLTALAAELDRACPFGGGLPPEADVRLRKRSRRRRRRSLPFPCAGCGTLATHWLLVTWPEGVWAADGVAVPACYPCGQSAEEEVGLGLGLCERDPAAEAFAAALEHPHPLT